MDTGLLFSTRRPLRIALAAVYFAATCAAAESQGPGADRVVAIADVHGAYEAMVETLGHAGILDEKLAWVGGNSYLVIVGDIVDRGPRSRDAMDLLMRLEGEAAEAGGRVHVLIGNHESMNMIGDLRYVSKAEYGAFAMDETPAQRERWFAAWAKRNGIDPDTSRERFDSKFPAGFFELREAFGSEGKYGKWLLNKDVIAVVNGTAFVHGGLPPVVAEIGLDGVNQGLTRELENYVKAVEILTEAGVLLPTDSYYEHQVIVDKYLPSLNATQEVIDAVATVKRLADSSIFTPDGPLWYRGNVACSKVIEAHRLGKALEVIGATRVVVGHTPTPSRRALQRFDGRVVEIDTGMLNFYYKGSGNALVIEGGELWVFNQSGEAAYVPEIHPREVGSRPGNLSPGELQRLLETGEIVGENKDAATGRTMVQVSDGTHTVSAIFSKRSSRGFFPDVAAYRLDRLLGLDMVPVTALRTVGKRQGSLQFLPTSTGDEGQRSASGSGSGAMCPLPRQWEAMYVFDVLIYNEGRSQKRMLYEPSDWSLILVEHDRAFKNARGRPAHLASVPLNMSDGWRQGLAGLNDTVLAQHLSDVLDTRRLKALGARRDQLMTE